jgi:hypothetical protein
VRHIACALALKRLAWWSHDKRESETSMQALACVT